MSIHVCKCKHKGKVEYHLRYPGMTEQQAQELANDINAGCLGPRPTLPKQDTTHIENRLDEIMNELANTQPIAMKLTAEALPLTYEVSFSKNYSSQARTLPAVNGYFKETGWHIEGEICEDYYKWINDFNAFHPIHGRVTGDFESLVKASSKEAYEQFLKDHPYDEWDYGDI